MECACKNGRQVRLYYLVGNVLKVQLFWEYPSDPAVSLDTIDFSVEYYTNPRSKVTVSKEGCDREEEVVDGRTVVNYYVYVDSNVTKAGDLMMRCMAYVPDLKAPNGIKPDYKEYDTLVTFYV